MKSSVSRRNYIQKLLSQEGSVSSQSLADELNVSLMTIYRDLDYLQEQGIARRESGGAVLQQRFFTPLDTTTADMLQAEKERIGRYAATHLVSESDGAIIISSGATTLEFAKALPDMPIHVMANSLAALGYLGAHQKTHLSVLGGELRKDIMAFGGTMAHTNLRHYHFAKAFIGINAIDLKAGVTSNSELNAYLIELMAEHAEEVYLLADHTKFGRKSFRHVLSFGQLTGVVTDTLPPRSYLDAFRREGVMVMVAEEKEGD